MSRGPATVRVVLADDHAPMRDVLREALEADAFEVVGEAASAPAAVEQARATRPDVCLLDIHMPGNGIAAAGEIARLLPDTAVVMLTHSREEDDLFDALRAGAQGYLLKDMDPERLGPTLRGVLAGEAALPRSLVTRVIEEFRGRPSRHVLRRDKRRARLTSREWEIMDLLRTGLSTDEVAKRLYLSPGTVRVHVSSVVRKLQAANRNEAIRMLLEDDRR